MSAIVADSLIVGRGSFRAGPFSFSALSGTLIAVIGPNGGGKTTLLKTLAGLVPTVAGRIERDSRHPAYLPPPGAIATAFPAEYVVALGRAGARGWAMSLGEADYRAARAAMAELGIDHFASRPFDQLSSGQQQLVLIARMTVQASAICLLDEPTAMLDPAQTARIDRAVDLLKARGRTVFVSTHRIAFAGLANLVVAVGNSVRVGSPGDILAPDVLSELYNTDVSICPSCGHWFCVSTRA